MKQRELAIQLMTASLLAVPLAVGAMAQSADELAQLIQQNIENIQVQIRVAPTKAEEDLEHQKRQLDTLRSEAPDHLLLPSLERQIAELEEEIVAARQQQPAAVEGTEQFVPLHAPAEVRRRLRQVETLQTRADREIMRGAPDSAVSYLSEADDLIEAIEDQYGDRIPPGYAALLVAKERGAALHDQLARTQED